MQFIRFVLESPLDELDPHWYPYSLQCTPCQVRVLFIMYSMWGTCTLYNLLHVRYQYFTIYSLSGSCTLYNLLHVRYLYSLHSTPCQVPVLFTIHSMSGTCTRYNVLHVRYLFSYIYIYVLKLCDLKSVLEFRTCDSKPVFGIWFK